MEPIDKTLPKALGAKCNECPLVASPYVLGAGPDRGTNLVVVGEAPGRDEVAGGIPFTGRSGKLMDRILQHYGIDRSDTRVTNACLCRPSNNDTPTAKAVECCRPRLIREIKLALDIPKAATSSGVFCTDKGQTNGEEVSVPADVQPVPNVHDSSRKSVLALGAVAAQSILGTKVGITKLRVGGPKTSVHLEGVRIICSFHPAAILRNPDYFPSLATDITKLSKIFVKWEPTKYKVIDDPNEAALYAQKQFESSRQLALDIENIVDFKKPDAKNPNWLCIGIAHRPGAAVVYSKEAVESLTFQNMLRMGLHNKDLTWVFHNGKYDVPRLWNFAPEARVDKDTMLSHYATDERSGTHGLEALGMELLSAPDYKMGANNEAEDMGKSFGDWPKDVLHFRNATDVDITLRLVEPLEKEMASDGVTKMYEKLLIPGANALARLETYGIRVDTDYAHGLFDEYQGLTDEAEAHFQDVVGEVLDLGRRAKINPRSWQQVGLLFARLGVPIPNTTKDTLQAIIDGERYPTKAQKAAQAKLAYAHLQKLFSTYVKGLEKHTLRGRIHPTIQLHVTAGGRLACRRPNLQNVPTGSTIRDAFIAGPDSVLINADYSQIEFVILAYLSNCEWLLNQFREGRKFHHEVAVKLFGENYSGLQYLRAKAQNFGLNYGREAYSLWKEHGGLLRDWERQVQDFFIQAPEIKNYHIDIERQILEQGYLESYFGRKRRFWYVNRNDKRSWDDIRKEGYSFPPQSCASDFTLDSLIRLEPILRGKAVPVLTVHDSLLFEAKKEYTDEVCHIIKEVMEDTSISDVVPTRVDIKVGKRWGFSSETKGTEWYEWEAS